VIGSRRTILATGLALAAVAWTALAAADDPVVKLRGVIVGANEAPLTFELERWSTDAERAPFVAALVPLPPAPAPAPAAAAAGGRGGRGAAGGRGGRGAAPPPSPEARLTTEVKAAPTIGFVWGDGPTGYSIKYAWRAPAPDGRERLVLVTDRRLGTHLASSAASAKAGDAEFTVIEMRLDGKGGEGKSSFDSPVVVDATAATLALGAYATAPIFIKVTR
jgi:hypothetical protein